ncbi:MAG: hypothetical protein ACYDG4_00865 [Desulfuromonadaceae bacterium]
MMLLLSLLLSGLPAWADSVKDRPDHLCSKAAAAEREAKEAERKSEERRRFLKGKPAITTSNPPPKSGETAAIRQSIKTKTAQVRAILPQLRQGAAAANRDKGIVPGLGQYFIQIENNLNTALHAIDACLDNPQYCSVPSISCPSPPPLPTFNNVGSADLLRNVQESYRQASEMARQACRDLNAGVAGDLERLRREHRTADTPVGGAASAQTPAFGEVDLYLRRAESLRREATQYRQEADRVSRISGYCSGQRRPRMDTDATRTLVTALKAGDKLGKTADPGLPLNAKVIDLKAGWGNKWNQGTSLKTSDVPLPKLSLGDAGETAPSWDAASSDDNGPSWWDKQKSAYKKADEEMALTEFLTSRPKQMAKFVAKEVVKHRLGGLGENLVNAYTILDAVKTTSDEVGQILVDAPNVIAHGSVSEARELAGRAERVPLNLLNSLFDDVTDWLPAPRRRNNGGARQ